MREEVGRMGGFFPGRREKRRNHQPSPRPPNMESCSAPRSSWAPCPRAWGEACPLQSSKNNIFFGGQVCLVSVSGTNYWVRPFSGRFAVCLLNGGASCDLYMFC